MKLKYVIALVVVAFAIGVFLPTMCNDSNVAYWKGRSEKALEDLKLQEEKFEESIEADKTLQEKKDKRIAELEEGIAADTQEIIVIHENIVVTREMLMSSGLYQGLVKELDEEWASKYSRLEATVVKKDKIIAAWIEKFDSKVEVAIKAYVDKDLKKQKAIDEFKKRCTAYERQIKGLKLQGTIWKYAAIGGGLKIGYDVIRGRI